MRIIVIAAFFITLAVTNRATAQVGGLDVAEVMDPFLNGMLPPRTPNPPTGSWRLTNAFPALTFAEPIHLVAVPRSNRLVVVEKWGRLVMFENEATVGTKSDLLDLRGQVESFTDSGMLGVAFHPDFGSLDSPNRHSLYVYYRYTPDPTETDRAYCRLSRFTWDPGTAAINPATEFVLINQYDRSNWHNGGGLFFGTDGFLYLSVGDEGGVDNLYGNGQRLDLALFGGALRIDVDLDPARSHPIRRQPLDAQAPPPGWPASFTQGYFIPNDNPWQSPAGGFLEEFFAIGLRSPHRMTQDPVTGEIWVGDVGQSLEEEVSKVPRGGNLQWPYREGVAAGPKPQPAQLIGTDTAPVHAYGRATGTCVIGGYTYRGTAHPELVGKYLFGDFGKGTISAIDDSGAEAIIEPLLSLATQPSGPTSGFAGIGLDADGEILVLNISHVDFGGCRIFRLEKTTGVVPEPPPLLSQTTAFSNLATLAPAPGVMPYGVIQPLWSDGAEKKRWIAIPNDGTPDSPAEQIVWSGEDDWSFPIGTVLIKHFEVPGRRLETRFFVNGDDGVWYGFTYRWREDGTDAELLPGAPVDETFTAAGTTRTWHFPGRSECFTCHNNTAGKVLGVKSSQLNGDFFYAKTGRTRNQLVTWNRLGFFSSAPDEASLAAILTAKNQGDTAATLERRARSYLDVNCAHCHQPGAPTPTFFDARLSTPPWSQNVIGATPNNPLDLNGAALIRPGEVDLSIIHVRTSSTTPGIAMPAIAKNVIDAEGVQLLTDWINSLDPTIGPTGRVNGPPPGDHSTPVLTLTRVGDSGPLVDGPFTVHLEASEVIQGLTAVDFAVNNGSIENLSGSGTEWTFTLVPASTGPGSITLAADRVVDPNGNANTALAEPLVFEYRLPNLLTGGGFESGLDGWERGTGVALTNASHLGSQAASLDRATFLTKSAPVSASSHYLWSGWIRSTHPGSPVEAGLTFWNGSGDRIADRILPLQPGAAWERFEMAFTAPATAQTVSIWILTNSSGGAVVDDLSLTNEGTPPLDPGQIPLLPNGDFESGSLSPWETGGSEVGLVPDSHSGSGAARLGVESFLVHKRSVSPGESFAFTGFHRTGGEVGFSFWSSTGAWLGDSIVALESSATFRAFEVQGIAPVGAVACSIWIWSGAYAGLIVDDLRLERLVTAQPQSDSAARFLGEILLAGEMTALHLKSGRTLALPLERDPGLAAVIGAINPVFADGWIAGNGTATARDLAPGARATLLTTVTGPGIVTALWNLKTPSSAALSLHVDGKERARWNGGSGWRTVSASVAGPGIHTIEFRMVRNGGEVAASLSEFRFLAGSPVLQPDLVITGQGVKSVGRGRYQAGGVGQSALVKTGSNDRALFQIVWLNQASELADGVTLLGSGGNRNHRPTYFQGNADRSNITAAVTTGLFESAAATPGAGASFSVEVRKRARSRASRFAGLLQARSLLDPAKADGVRFETLQR